jgi:hypothetical protein
MCLRKKSHRVSPCDRKCLYSFVFVFTILFGQVTTSSDNSDNHGNIQRKLSSSGSGSGGTLEKRSSYAVISDAFSQTVNNEFGSE